MRNILISDLYRDLLGPRDGPYETMQDDPINEYITGVLAPKVHSVERDPDQEAELPTSVPENLDPIPEDEVEDDAYIILNQQTFLDPRSRPSSMGISFCIAAQGNLPPCIQLCLCWARYFKDVEGRTWNRMPRWFVTEPITIFGNSNKKMSIDDTGRECEDGSGEISVYIISKELASGIYYVSIYLVNELVNSSSCQRTTLHIFQPQIRVRCLRGSIEPLKKTSVSDDWEERELELVYQKRTIRARGHMCSAVWQEIDPEKEYGAISSDELSPPFLWADGVILDEDNRRKFTAPDVRSEFLPMLSVESPDYEWNTDKYGHEPELRAWKLAELWDPDELRDALQPLVDGYSRWVDELKKEIARNFSYNNEVKETAERIEERCRNVLERMRRGIKLLISDSDVRLAFCFAYKAMDLQYRWKYNAGLQLRPFQLAFVLLVLESIANKNSDDRKTCDILFVPTGAGKTEAYLAVAAFTLALRRRRVLSARRRGGGGSGTGVIMRYTLRLLTIQQFRRALGMITACEYLRVSGLGRGMPVGWRPKCCELQDDFIWGGSRFSTGLWVGGSVTPNRLKRSGGETAINGAIEILRGERGEGEPAQILNCPVCNSVLSVPDGGLPPERECMIHLIVRVKNGSSNRRFDAALHDAEETISETFQGILESCNLFTTPHENNFLTATLKLKPRQEIRPEHLDKMWEIIDGCVERTGTVIELCSARASRPGYFILNAETRRGTQKPYNFVIYCPNPRCELNSQENLWAESRPAGLHEVRTIPNGDRNVVAPYDTVFADVPEFARKMGSSVLAYRIPIPVLTVDEQLYIAPPDFLIGTVDKFARISFEPRCGSIFGNVDKYHPVAGYYRGGLTPQSFTGLLDIGTKRSVDPLDPPDLIIQDELHLIEGPLGSMVGVYERAIDFLASEGTAPVKYIASSATVRGANTQVETIFARKVLQFPPHGLDADDRFFMRYRQAHPLDETNSGRVYLGVCAPGWGPLTPTVRIWARLLQTSFELAQSDKEEADPFWTLVGYFNSIRELAGARSLCRQDIPERIKVIARHTSANHSPRELTEDRIVELSSRIKSTDLPVMLNKIETRFSGNTEDPGAFDVMLTTSMFGTGVDVPRLSLMVVQGQPKTTAGYIQSTGRVGRRKAGLVVTFYRSVRPRDMSHYEMFCGYHLNLERFVEHVTSAPFSPGALDRCAGPVAVGILRNMRCASVEWHADDSAHLMADHRHADEVNMIPAIFNKNSDPTSQKSRYIGRIIAAALDRWRNVAQQVGDNLKYAEYVKPLNPVVLGDPKHKHAGLTVVYENAPQSLRDLEETTGFEV